MFEASFLARACDGAGKSHYWIYVITLCVDTPTTVYFILDIEYPLLGFIRIDSVNQNLVKLSEDPSRRRPRLFETWDQSPIGNQGSFAKNHFQCCNDGCNNCTISTSKL